MTVHQWRTRLLYIRARPALKQQPAVLLVLARVQHVVAVAAEPERCHLAALLSYLSLCYSLLQIEHLSISFFSLFEISQYCKQHTPHTAMLLHTLRNPARRAVASRLCLLRSFHGTHPVYTEPAQHEDVPPHIQGLVEQISKLTLSETSVLVKSLKTTLNIPDTGFMMAPPAGMNSVAQDTTGATEGAEGKEETDEDSEAKSSAPKTQNVILQSFDTKSKAKLIKEMKQLLQLSLVDAKKFVEGAPKMVKENLNADEASELKVKLEKIGGKVTLE